MGIDANIWNYRRGEPIGFQFDVILEILTTQKTSWDGEFGLLNVWFQDPEAHVRIFLGKDAPKTNLVRGIMIDRPIVHPDYLSRVFRLLQLGDVILFYSDDTTPVFVRGANPGEYPSDLLAALGTPRFIDAPYGLLHQT